MVKLTEEKKNDILWKLSEWSDDELVYLLKHVYDFEIEDAIQGEIARRFCDSHASYMRELNDDFLHEFR